MRLYGNTTAKIPNWAQDQKPKPSHMDVVIQLHWVRKKIVLRGSKTYLLNKLALKYSR